MKKIKNYIVVSGFALILFVSGCSKGETLSLIANAGSDKVAKPLDHVALDGSKSTGPKGFTYSWVYVGPVPENEINLQNKTSSAPTFIPPAIGLYAFTLTITSSSAKSEDIVWVEVI
jgi:hypothetical protein